MGHTEPRVVKFAFKEFRLSGEKWMAVCQKCKKRIQDTANVTSALAVAGENEPSPERQLNEYLKLINTSMTGDLSLPGSPHQL